MFIDIEGIDGFIRAALAEAVTARLSKLGYRVARGEQPRTTGAAGDTTAQARFFLEAAKSSQLLESFIRPTLARGEVAVANGYVYGPLAEACAEGADRFEALESTAQIAAQGMWPDLVVLVDSSPSITALRSREDRASARATFVREHLLEQARRDPHRWVIVEADFVRADAVAEQVLDLVLRRLTGSEGEPRPKLLPRSNRLCIDDPAARYFEAVDALEESDGALAISALTGVGGPAAHQRRLRWVSGAPQAVACSLRGVTDQESWTLRDLLSSTAPEAVLQSVRGDASARALRLRAQLIDADPKGAVRTLQRDDSPQAWWLREYALRMGEPSAVLESLGGLDDPRSWRLRAQHAAGADRAALLGSIRGLSCPKAEALRDRCVEALPVEVLASLEGVDTRHARQLRTQLFSRHPAAVVASLRFVDSAHAWELREKAAPRCPEALLSVTGMSCEAAFSLRERYVTRWPAEAIASLGPLAATARGVALTDRALRSSSELYVLRAAYIARQKARPAREPLAAKGSTVASPPPV